MSNTRPPIPFSHTYHGANIKLTMDGLTAERFKSYNFGMVVSAAPLEDNLLYQVEIRKLSDSKGSVKIGVTGLPLDTVSRWKRWLPENDPTTRTIVLDRTEDGRLCVCCKGQKSEVGETFFDLESLCEGESLGVVCIEGGIRFLVNGKIAAHVPIEAPHPRHVLVDVYGPVTEVKVLPMQWRDSLVLRIGQLPKDMTKTRIYYGYFNWSYYKCYCAECYNPDTHPNVKSKGQPPEDYAIPIGWTKFALWVPKRAEVLDVFRKWHVCYHGTPVDSVAPILECGQLMIRGDKTLPNRQSVPCPKNHFTEIFKPDRYNIEQIFLSPSLHYCTHGEVYAGTQSCVDSQSGRTYSAKVAFQLRVHPKACTVSKQTTQKTDTQIDPYIPNDKLEWATEYRSSTILCALCVKLVEGK